MQIRNRWTDRFLPKSTFLYRYCVRYVNFFENHDCRMMLNGKFKFAKKTLPSAKIVFDIGANIGEWAQMAISINPTIQLHCFEPSKHTFQQLLTRKFPGNVALNNVGLGSKKENKSLYGDQPASGSSSLFRREGLDALEESVLIDTFDNYVEQSGIQCVDFAKIDVEGFELEVLKGMSKVIERGQVKIIQLEYNSTYIDARVFLKDVWDFVLDKNSSYQFYEIFPDGTKLHEKYSQKLENFLYANWAIIKRY